MGTYNGTYSQQQEIYSLSFIANAAFGLSMPSLQALQDYVTAVTTQVLNGTTTIYNPTKYIGTDWVSVWGTVVYSKNPSATAVVVDNAMGSFYSPSQNLFVVAIAGTNGNSSYDWLSEDLDLGTTAPWQAVIGSAVKVPGTYSGAAIATGMNNGLQILIAMEDANGQTMAQALTAYIAANGITGATLAITGHSLAGALCSVLSLYMYQIQQDSALNWNTAGGVTTINAYPTASPTPGEANFAAYYASVVAGSNGAFSHTSLYNSMDVVPQAWSLDNMATVPGIYDAHLSPNPAAPWMGPVVYGMMCATVQSGNNNTPIAYTPIAPRTVLPGTYSTLAMSVADGTLFNYLDQFGKSGLSAYENMAKSIANFFVQMIYQHTTAYTGSNSLSTGLLQIGAFIEDYDKIKASVTGGATAEELQAKSVAAVLGRHLPGLAPKKQR